MSAIRHFPVQLTSFPKHVQTKPHNTLVYWLHSALSPLHSLHDKALIAKNSSRQNMINLFFQGVKTSVYLANSWPHSTTFGLKLSMMVTEERLHCYLTPAVSELSLSYANCLRLTCPPTFFCFSSRWYENLQDGLKSQEHSGLCQCTCPIPCSGNTLHKMFQYVLQEDVSSLIFCLFSFLKNKHKSWAARIPSPGVFFIFTFLWLTWIITHGNEVKSISVSEPILHLTSHLPENRPNGKSIRTVVGKAKSYEENHQ